MTSSTQNGWVIAKCDQARHFFQEGGAGTVPLLSYLVNSRNIMLKVERLHLPRTVMINVFQIESGGTPLSVHVTLIW